MNYFLKIFFIIFLFILAGCRHNSTPEIVNVESFIYSENEKLEVSEIDNTKFKFVKRGNVYFIVKDEKEIPNLEIK
jgi:hypothetical protein